MPDLAVPGQHRGLRHRVAAGPGLPPDQRRPPWDQLVAPPPVPLPRKPPGRPGRRPSGPGGDRETAGNQAGAAHMGAAGPLGYGGIPDAGPPEPSDAETVLRNLP